MENREYFEKFRDLEISKKELVKAVGFEVFKNKTKEIVEVKAEDILKTLEALKYGKLSLEEFMDWVDTVWYVSLYDFRKNEEEKISLVMNELEEVDIDINKISDKNIAKYVNILKSN